MLTQLSIRNFALIASADIAFSTGFTSITGETGSGKSILLGALNLILGERADYSVIRDTEKKTVVEAVFQIADIHKEWFLSQDIDWETETVIRREITAQGKSRAFINDTPVQLTQLKELTEQLIYIHSQHQTLELKKPGFQLALLDGFAGIAEPVFRFQTDFKRFRKEQQQLEQLRRQLIEQQQEADYIRFQLEELEELELDKHDYAAYELELSRFGQLDDLKLAYDALANGLTLENGPVDGVRTIRLLVDKWKHVDPELENLATRLASTMIELDDIASEAASQLESMEMDPERQATLIQLVDRYNQLLRKHHVQSQEELTALMESYQNRFESNEELEQQIETLSQKITHDLGELTKTAQAFHEKRIASAKKLEVHLLGLMADLKLPDAQLNFEVTPLPQLNENGLTEVQLLFSANAGMSPKPIDKTASGGELSRLMLAVQATMSDLKSLPTLILDEIDTGVSGEVALRIGKLLRKMGERLQLFAITHLPQVAAKGQQQYEVSKASNENGTTTRIYQLNDTERLDAIARLMSGDSLSEAAKANAQLLLN
ncbi:MAG: DNA repair protein RecN [Candidatus Fluviicola riflensis]|nr:MAG: DNA repair protein RecN [Candidatus Fluviicola riflensis]OGS79161.1 MAG: DNA repair protein RecN [Candidatus Fluviicola riflensis]OGS86593.1 MAG: DNA repair protein RecN [Fluviicola sp. RIFCSPHIGHO2_01_FULL_43_53]OGS88933.1 MAG: DNA repair protein RecN [Fluviicola sp. RIFCSPHIGHO2_12_FULL_43_24]